MLTAKPWDFEAVIRLLLYVFLGLSLVSVVMQLVGGGEGADQPNNWLLMIGGTLAIHVVSLGAVHRFLRSQNTGWVEGFGLTNDLPRALRIAVIGTVIALPIALLLNAVSVMVFQLFQSELTVQPAVKVLEEAKDWPQQLAFGLMAIVAAPIVEEVFFRGIIYPLIKHRGYPRGALWGSALLFGLIHAHPLTLLPLTFLGVALALLYEATDNLMTPIVAHAIFNAANFAWLMAN